MKQSEHDDREIAYINANTRERKRAEAEAKRAEVIASAERAVIEAARKWHTKQHDDADDDVALMLVHGRLDDAVRSLIAAESKDGA